MKKGGRDICVNKCNAAPGPQQHGHLNVQKQRLSADNNVAERSGFEVEIGEVCLLALLLRPCSQDCGQRQLLVFPRKSHKSKHRIQTMNNNAKRAYITPPSHPSTTAALLCRTANMRLFGYIVPL